MLLNPLISNKKQYVLPHAATYRHKLDVIENQFPSSQHVINAIANVATKDINLYPHPTATYTKLLEHISSYTGVPKDQIILTNGSDTALKILCDGYIMPNINIVVPEPTYPHFLMFAETLTSIIVKPRIYLEDTPEDIVNKLLNTIDNHTNMCYIVSPNLPLGYVIAPELVELLLVSRPSTLFVVDEAYVEFGGNTAAGLIKHHQNLVVVRTFSKTFGLAALRIGYMMSSSHVINYLKVIVNDKNVTAIAIAAATAAMEDLDYYLGIAAMCETMKIDLRARFNKLCHPESLIYKVSITAANFYLLFSKDTKQVCKIFADHGVYIRDKSNDVANSMRVALGRPDQNSDVLKLVEYINLSFAIKSRPVIFDLDNTLRPTSKNSAAVFKGSQILEHCDSYIYTNNSSYTPEEISKYFQSHSIHIDSTRIFSPLTAFREIAKQYQNYAVLGRIAKWFPNQTPLNEATQAVFLACDYFLNEVTIIQICKLGKQGKLYYAYEATMTTLDDYADCDELGHTQIPDVGAIAHMLESVITTISVGKPNKLSLDFVDPVVVGDGKSDRDFAQSIGATFIKVGCEKNRCAFNWIELESIDALYQLLS